MPVPDPDSPVPSYEQIAADLRAKITDGTYKVGGRLPVQRDLARTYSVTVTTLQAALRVLSGQGTISRGSTRGTFILAVPDPEPPGGYAALAAEVRTLTRRLDRIEAALERGEYQG
jgi:GntR family transcriptional regulator